MRTFLISFIVLFTASCATKWQPKSTNPLASQENTLKTDWGHIKIDYDKTTDEGIFFNIELKNDSKAPVKYERGYVTLLSNKGDKYSDLQNKYLGQNIKGAAKFAEKGNMAGVLVAGIKSLWQSAKILGNGDISPNTLHTDRLIYSKKSTKGDVVTLVFGPELVTDTQKNSISFTTK